MVKVEMKKENNEDDKPKKKRVRCRKCANCVRQECGKCIFCLDKPKFGGELILKQTCAFKKCLVIFPNYKIPANIYGTFKPRRDGEYKREFKSSKSPSNAALVIKSANSKVKLALKEARKTQKPQPFHKLKYQPTRIRVPPLSQIDEKALAQKFVDKNEPYLQCGKPFLQYGACYNVAPYLDRCLECRRLRGRQVELKDCRFYEFRRLSLQRYGNFVSVGLAQPQTATREDIKTWFPLVSYVPADMDQNTSKFIFTNVAQQLCEIVQEERKVYNSYKNKKKVAWKKNIPGVRELCDICETTLFNLHWVCQKCGFVACIDCYKAKVEAVKVKRELDEVRSLIQSEQRKARQLDDQSENKKFISPRARDEEGWLLCKDKVSHDASELMLTQIIADKLLWQMDSLIHCSLERWKIPAYCSCLKTKVRINNEKQTLLPNGICKPLMNLCLSEQDINVMRKKLSPRKVKGTVQYISNSNDAKENIPCDSFLKSSDVKSGAKLRQIITKSTVILERLPMTTEKAMINKVDCILSCLVNCTEAKKQEIQRDRYPQPSNPWEFLPIRIFTHSESSLMFPNVPHKWLCFGRLLRLCDPLHPLNNQLFHEVWKRGQPVMVSQVNKALDMSLWHPEAFSRDFGHIKTDLVNCHTGHIVPDQPMYKFWQGFEKLTQRMVDKQGRPMLLKLKDWPPGEDFSELLPTRFEDLMKALPMPDYTHRYGRYNLACRPPECFVRPDLGPKMYIAYGSALYPSKGTTNLHLDMSDAVNVMVYVGVPEDGDCEKHVEEALKAIDDADCDILTRRRVREKGEKPGALWHIYNAVDAPKIRELLHKVSIERGIKLKASDDPIHDQVWYLDSGLRDRLYAEYNVQGYAIVQCLGDAIFIPAGAPHQVRNLHNCIKVAEDFVSPENISHCYTLMQEFRKLSDKHSNHEDKLQIKNIIYHSVKDALSVLLANEKQ